MSSVISIDVNNYLKYYGFSKIYPILKNIKCERKVLHGGFEIPKYLDKFKYSRLVISNFIDFLIAKMMQINFSKQIKKFELNIIYKLEKFPQKIRQNYIDELNDWRNLLEDIFFIATYNIKDEGSIFNDLKNLLINNNIYSYYNEISEKLYKFISESNPKEINSHYNVTHAKIKGEIDILVDNKIFEIKTNQGEIATMTNIIQTLLYGYLLNKKERIIDEIILYNPLTGEINLFDTKDFNFKKISSIIYEHFKQKTN
jgi:hypothetical protein